MNKSDLIIAEVLKRCTIRPVHMNLFVGDNSVVKGNKLVKNVKVLVYDLKTKQLLNFPRLECAEQVSSVNLVKIMLDSMRTGKDNEEKFMKSMLLGLVHYIKEKELKYYQNKGLDIYINKLHDELKDYTWFGKFSKNTYPFEIAFDFYTDIYEHKKLISNTDEVLSLIILDSLSNYRLAILESNPRGYTDIFADGYIQSLTPPPLFDWEKYNEHTNLLSRGSNTRKNNNKI